MKVKLALAAAAAVLVGMLTVLPASAQYVGGQPPAAGPIAGPTVQVQGQAVPVNVQVGRASTRVGGVAFTGADITQMVLLGGGLVLVGALVVRQTRRRAGPSGS